MCGIYGGYNSDGFSNELLSSMSKYQLHRGPDDTGSYINKNFE